MGCGQVADPADAGDAVRRRRDRVGVTQTETRGEHVAGAVGDDVCSGVRRIQGHAAADQPREQRTLVAVLRDARHAAQKQRMVRDQQVGAELDRFVDGGGDRVDGEQDALDLAPRIAGDETGRIPALGTGERPELLDGVADGGEGVRHVDQPTGWGRAGARRNPVCG